MYDIKAAIAAEVAVGPDMTKSTKGAGRTIAAAGPTRLRFVGYVELGRHQGRGKAAAKEQDRVQLVFELSGKNHPPREFEGKKFPQVIVVEETKSLNEKANFFKLFSKMNWAGKATHIAELLGEGFKGTVSHYTFKGSTGEDVTIAQLRSDGAYQIEKPFRVDDDDQLVPLVIDQALTPIKFFAWNTATKEQWDSLFIDGEYEAEKDEATGKITRPAKSKNAVQNKIKLALNFKGSPIESILKLNGVALDVGSADVPSDEDEGVVTKAATGAATTTSTPTGQAADDVLNGIVPQ